MRRIAAALSLCLLVSACAVSPERGLGALALNEADARRQIVLTVRQDRNTAVQLRGAPDSRYATRRGYGPSPGVDRVLNQLARAHDLERVDGWTIGSLDVYCEVFAVEDGVEIDALVEKLRRDPRVELVQRMSLFDTLLGRYDDPYADLQASVDTLEIEPAHAMATGKGVTVAVIDSAVDDRHPDLRGRVGVNRNLVEGHRSGRRGEIHGTAIAGIIASQANNTEGIVGVAPDVSIAALRACWAVDAQSSAARCSSFSLALAIETAMSLDAQILNLSLSGPHDPLLAQLLDVAIARGIVVVAAANDALADAGFPASHAGVIAARSASGKGASLDALRAPGSEILTTTLDSGYAFFSGNSLAAAHVSGVIALLLEREPAIDAGRLTSLLAESSRRPAAAGSISACRALVRLTGSGWCDARVEAAL